MARKSHPITDAATSTNAGTRAPEPVAAVAGVSDPSVANDRSVTVRMYRGMLGDCFLLTVRNDGKIYTILIDCGVLQNVQSGDEMKRSIPEAVRNEANKGVAQTLDDVVDTRSQAEKVASDILATLDQRKSAGGRATLDVLAVTHEHYDHLSGFTLNWDMWQNADLDIGQLWMAWTENPVDSVAIGLKSELSLKQKAVRLAARATAAVPLAVKGDRGLAAQEAIEGLLSFLGPDAEQGLAAGTGQKTNADTLAMLKRKAGDAAVRYLQPGMVIEVDTPHKLNKAVAPGLRTYVLGPPRDTKRLKKDTPSQGAAKEVYLARNEMALAIGGTALRMIERHPVNDENIAAISGAKDGATPNTVAVVAAAAAATTVATEHDLARAGSDSPFAVPHRQPFIYDELCADDHLPDESVNRRRLRELYAHGNPGEDIKMVAERRIDGEWVAGAEALAMKLDSDTNNTSLVLAFEMPDAERRVLLFAADAQVGNWLSWGDQPYPAEPAAGETQQTVDQLLARTVFYKVGHHGSHNATAKERGLQLMTHPQLCAAIPVVEAVARIQGPGKKTPGKGWHMPYEPMYEELKKRTGGHDDADASKARYPRIIRGDGNPAVEATAFPANGQATTTGLPCVQYGPDSASEKLWVELTYRF